ncbi:hypothetical protein Pcinc_008324 [Petrolisthes cinctipes]|uniref:Uncharacterized protein n=1 Tax=Petrolisthes cinctipes TaxID=88211 RepID=A0AAE1KZL8_PETCI|nr:hypothetical protein Pcinc_008324 [Petrolisthes cinctipes]
MDVATFRILTRCALLMMVVFTTGIDGDAEQISEMVREMLELHHSRCRLIFFNLTPHVTLISSFNRLLDDTGLWKLPDTEVLILGRKSEVEAVLLHRCFRNTIHATYFGFHSEILEAPTSIQRFRPTKVSTKNNVIRPLQVKRDANNLFSDSKDVLDLHRDKKQQINGTPILPEAKLPLGLPEPDQAAVDHPFEKFTEADCECDVSETLWLYRFFANFTNRRATLDTQANYSPRAFATTIGSEIYSEPTFSSGNSDGINFPRNFLIVNNTQLGGLSDGNPET